MKQQTQTLITRQQQHIIFILHTRGSYFISSLNVTQNALLLFFYSSSCCLLLLLFILFLTLLMLNNHKFSFIHVVILDFILFRKEYHFLFCNVYAVLDVAQDFFFLFDYKINDLIFIYRIISIPAHKLF